MLRLLILKLEMSGILNLAPLTCVPLVKFHNLLRLNFLMPFVLQYHPPYCAFHFHTCVTMQRPFWPFQASAFCFLCLWNTIHPSWSNTNATFYSLFVVHPSRYNKLSLFWNTVEYFFCHSSYTVLYLLTYEVLRHWRTETCSIPIYILQDIEHTAWLNKHV